MKQLRHIVLFKFNLQADDSALAKIDAEFKALEFSVPSVKSFESGTNNSPEGLTHGFTHAYTLTFHSEKGRDEYLHHPIHKAFQKLVEPVLENVLVFDYWTE